MERLLEDLNILVAVLGLVVWIVTIVVAWMRLEKVVALINQKLASNISSNTESISDLKETFQTAHSDTRDWLKALQTGYQEHDGDIKVLKDRTEGLSHTGG